MLFVLSSQYLSDFLASFRRMRRQWFVFNRGIIVLIAAVLLICEDIASYANAADVVKPKEQKKDTNAHADEQYLEYVGDFVFSCERITSTSYHTCQIRCISSFRSDVFLNPNTPARPDPGRYAKDDAAHIRIQTRDASGQRV